MRQLVCAHAEEQICAWPQVRYAACVAARAFMLAAGNGAERFYPTLLPALAFNRYDVAEGVASYSRDTWRLVMADRGRAAVAACLPQARVHERPLTCAFLPPACARRRALCMVQECQFLPNKYRPGLYPHQVANVMALASSFTECWNGSPKVHALCVFRS